MKFTDSGRSLQKKERKQGYVQARQRETKGFVRGESLEKKTEAQRAATRVVPYGSWRERGGKTSKRSPSETAEIRA